MARLFITPFMNVGTYAQRSGDPGSTPLPRNALASQRMTLTGTSAQSTALPVNAQFVYLLAEEAAQVWLGVDPTAADGTEIVLAANTPVYLALPDGVSPCKIAAKTLDA